MKLEYYVQKMPTHIYNMVDPYNADEKNSPQCIHKGSNKFTCAK